jgi:hypothetical protein
MAGYCPFVAVFSIGRPDWGGLGWSGVLGLA